ncbi:hypothetical protein PG995_013658 [Apiospora arundinis]
MLGFALGDNVADLSVYKDPGRLTKTFEAMHQLMFSLAVSRVSSLEARSEGNVTGVARVPRCHSKLIIDPDSIRTVASLAKQSASLRMELSRMDTGNDDDFRRNLHKHHFYLRSVEDGVVQLEMASQQHAPENDNNHQYSRQYTPAVPMAMKPLSGLVFVQLALVILENYVPIVFATLVESLWVLLNRLLAAIQPFTELQHGHSPGSRSTDLNYTSLPPQLLFWKAARAKHLLLGLVCIVTILGNGLSVSLGGLFNELPVMEDEAVAIPILRNPSINNNTLTDLIKTWTLPTGYNDHFTIAHVYLTTGTRLPPWLTEQHYFLPFDLEPMLTVAAESYTARTYGVTLMPSCQPLAPTTLTRTNLDPPEFSAQPAAPWLKCLNSTEFARNPFELTGKLGVTLHLPLDQCGWPWYRAPIRAWARSVTDNESTLIRKVEITGVSCQPRFAAAEFNVTVDSTGRVLRSNRINDFKPVETGLELGSELQIGKSLASVAFDATTSYNKFIYWFNTTDAGDHVDYLAALRNNIFTDPATPLPHTDTLVSETEAVMRLLAGAILQQNPALFEVAADSTPTIQGTRRITVTKIFMGDIAFIISMVLLSVNVVTAMVVYVFGPTPFLPRFPDTIGSVLGYVAKSRLTEPDWEAITSSSEDEGTAGEEKTRKTTYSFGRYTDRDGNEHLGIDVDPFVVKVDREGNPEWHGHWHGYDTKTSWLARFRGRKSRSHESDEPVEN